MLSPTSEIYWIQTDKSLGTLSNREVTLAQSSRLGRVNFLRNNLRNGTSTGFETVNYILTISMSNLLSKTAACLWRSRCEHTDKREIEWKYIVQPFSTRACTFDSIVYIRFSNLPSRFLCWLCAFPTVIGVSTWGKWNVFPNQTKQTLKEQN